MFSNCPIELKNCYTENANPGKEVGFDVFFGISPKGWLSYHLCIECFSQLSFDSEVYTKSATAADFVYISESNESCEKHSMQQ